MSNELKTRIEKEAEEKYVKISTPQDSNSFDQEVYRHESLMKLQREAYIAGATPYAERVEAIRAEVEERKRSHIDIKKIARMDGTRGEVISMTHYIYEDEKVLSIIDKHLNSKA